jgi:autotransporter-associated beta strand protein
MNRRQLCGFCAMIGISWIVFYPMSAFGQLLVTDRVSNQILEYNLDGSFRRVLVPPTSTIYTPSGLALGNGKDLFVTSLSSGTVLRYNWTTGAYLGVFASGLYGPSGLLFDHANNSLYVSEFGNADGHEIVCYNASSGAEITRFGNQSGGGFGDMATGSDGKLYVSDWYFGQITRFDPANNYSAEVFAGAANLWGSNGLVFDPSGNLDVVEMMTHNVYQFNSSGEAVGELVAAAGGGLNFPSDIVIDPDGNLLVSSMGDDKATPPVSGYIGKYNLTTGAAINSSFITFSGSTLVQPAAMLIEPYAVWTGGATGINSWTNGANWGGTAPVDPGAVRFGAVAGGHVGNNNDFAAGTTFNGITFAADAPQYTLQGNAIKLGGPVVNQSANDQEIDLDMQLALGSGSFDTGDQKLTIGGVLSEETGGMQSLTKTGSGELVLKAINTYTGATNINQGTLTIDGSDLADSSTVNVAGGAILQVISGTPGLGDVAGSGSTIISGAGTVLTVNSFTQNTLTMDSGTTLNINPIPGGLLSLQSIQPVPEPGTIVLLSTAGLLAPFVFLSRRRKT